MAPQLIHQTTAIRVAGLQIRTRNADEMPPATQGKIMPLWQAFRSQGVYGAVPGTDPASPVYGVYTAYESDHDGAYTLTAGIALTPDAAPPEDYAEVRIAPGDYLVFEAVGPMPQCVIAAWQQVWHYFAAADAKPAYQRRYTSDFEECISDTAVRLHIAVMPA
jgi:predicted transcriptional regulator YdeE